MIPFTVTIPQAERDPQLVEKLKADLGRRWLPDRAPRAIVQIAHGLAEHSARYARLAGALNSAGYGTYDNDLRGHGPSCAPADLGRGNIAARLEGAAGRERQSTLSVLT